MSADTSYASLLEGVWAPEGSEMSERLKRLQGLEQMRKDREARRQELLKEKGPIGVVRTARLKTSDPETESISEPPRIQRALSLRDISRTQEIYSGARPKVIGLSLYGSDSSDGSKSIFSEVTSSLLAPGRALRNYQGSSDSDDSSSSGQNAFSAADMGNSNLYDEPKLYRLSIPETEQQESIFSSVTKSLIKPRRAFERRQYVPENTRNKEFRLLDGDSKLFTFGFNNPNTKSNDSGDNDNQQFEFGDNSSDSNRKPFGFGDNSIDSNMKPLGFGLSNSHNNSYDFNFGKIHYSRDNEEDAVFANDNDEVHENESEDAKDFIDRLNAGRYATDSGSNGVYYKNNTSYLLHSLPTVPPLKKLKSAGHSLIDQYSDVPELVQPMDDIIAVAQTIHKTFGVPSPTTPNTINEIGFSIKPQQQHNIDSADDNAQVMKEVSHLQKNEKVEGFNGEYSITYDIHEDNYDSSGDERGKVLPVRDSLYKADPSQWVVLDQTPGELDRMQKYFTGKDVVDDPNISRELDGNMVREELEMSYSDSQLEKDNFTCPKLNGTQSQKNKHSFAGTKTEVTTTSSLRNTIKFNNVHITKEETTGCENYTVPTSESDPKKGMKRPRTPPQNCNNETNNTMNLLEPGLTDKLAMLESLTKEKSSKKHVNGDNEAMSADTSGTTGTSETLMMQARDKDDSPKQLGTDLKQNLRELKRYVHENCSELNSPTKSLSEFTVTNKNKNLTKEIGIQTDLVNIPTVETVYTCKHCGKSSNEQVDIVLSKDGKSSVVNNDKILESASEKEAVLCKVNVGSKELVKSFDDVSVKSDIIEVKNKPAKYAGRSYMQGTASSKLKNTGQNITGTQRKASVPELVLHNGNDTNGKDSAAETINMERDNTNQKVSAIDKSMLFEKTKLEGKSDKEKNTPGMSLFRGKSVDRNTTKINNTFQNAKSKMIKSKSVEHVSFLRKDTSTNELSAIKQSAKKEKGIVVTNKSNVGDKRPKTGTKLKSVSSKPVSVSVMHPGGKMNLSSLEKKTCVDKVTSQLCSPIQETNEGKVNPRNDCESINNSKNVESKSLFKTFENNPFIKNEMKCTNCSKAHDKIESPLEKTESHSKDISLPRSVSIAELEKTAKDSSLQQSSTSAEEKSTLTQLSWSDSGSDENFKGSKSCVLDSNSNLYGSSSTLNKNENALCDRPRTMSVSSVTSQNAMLNLLSPIGTTRNPISGAIETDIDAAYNSHMMEHKMDETYEEYNEQTVDKGLLQFAKEACDSLLEFELEKRDSSNESNSDKDVKDSVKFLPQVSSNEDQVHSKEPRVYSKESQENNCYDTVSLSSVKSASGKQEKSSKKQKGFFKGKFFRR